MSEWQLEHVAITVSDLDRSIEWYGRHFGCETLSVGDKPDLRVRVALLRLGDRALEIFQPYEPRPLPEGESELKSSLQAIGVKHMALAVEDAAEAYRRLEAGGVDMVGELGEGRTSRYFFCRDPDGLLIEVIQRHQPL